MNRTVLWALIAGMMLVLAGNAWMPVTDPVESNYALTAREMLEAGDFISPRIYGNFWYDKPIFFYWELIAAFSLFGVNDFAARFFPVVFSALNVGAVYCFAKKLYDERTAVCSALVFATTTSFFYLSRAIITDMAFVFFFNAVLISFYLAYRSGNRRLYLASFFFAGLAVLTKGPVGILMPGLILLVFLLVRRRTRELMHMMWAPGIVIFAAVGGYWYYRMYAMHGMDFITNFFGVHNFLRATVSEHPRDDVWYYYTLIFLLGFFPWSFVMIARVKAKWQEIRHRKWSEHVIFLVLWAGLVNVLFQLMATKYVTYTQPAFLPLAILAGHLLRGRERFVRRLAAGMGIFYLVLNFAVAVPLIQSHSGRAVAEKIESVNTGRHLVVSYGDYSASTVYYSHERIPWIVWRSEIAHEKPAGISWDAKNVMPFMAIEDLPVGEPIYVTCIPRQAERMQRELPNAKFRRLTERKYLDLYEMVIPDAAAKQKGSMD